MYETCCFTGPRPHNLFPGPANKEKSYNRASYQPLLDELKRRVAQLCEIGVETFLTGGAQGVDQIAFWAVHHVKKQYPHIRNVVCLPFEGYGERFSYKGAFGKGDVKTMLDHADAVQVLMEGKPAQSDVPRALTDRNHYMVDRSDLVLGVSTEREFLKAKGGTAECLRYAERQGKAIRVLHPLDKNATQFEVLHSKPCVNPEAVKRYTHPL